jgi:hypothetical protein
MIEPQRMTYLMPNQMLLKGSKFKVFLVFPKDVKPAIIPESGPFTSTKIGSTFNTNIGRRGF